MIRQTLRDLPAGLVQTYQRILLKISKSSLSKREIALRVFRWTICSRRPMKAQELQEAVAIESSDKYWDRDKIPDENLMIETCRGLLVRDEGDGTVRFAHHTVQQYLLSAPVIRTPEGPGFTLSSRSEAEAFVGQVCVTYLCFCDFETQITLRTPKVHLEAPSMLIIGGPVRIPTVLGIGKSLLEISYRILGGKSATAPLNIDYSRYLTPNTRTPPQVPSGLMEKYRLLEYIVEYWMDHTRGLGPALDAKLRHLVMHKTLSFEFRSWGLNQHFGPYGCASCPDITKAKELPFMSLFHYAAQVGHWNLMESLVTEYCQHELPLGETLLIACRQGRDLIVQNLMRRINFDISDGRAVNVAAAAGHANVLKYFMDLSENNAEDGRKPSSYNFIANAPSLLDLAATNGHEEVVDIIFAYCRRRDSEGCEYAYINEKSELSGRTAFFSAVMSGHENIVHNLLVRGAQIMAHGTTAIHFAAEYGHEEILRMLLEIAVTDFDGDDNAETSDTDVFSDGTEVTYSERLLHSFDSEGDTPLHKAANNGHSAIVGLMLENPHLVTARKVHTKTGWRFMGIEHMNSDGYTALHLAARGGHLDALKILRDNGATIARTCDRGWTALHLAADGGHEAVVHWLLQNGARLYANAHAGPNALRLAVSGGHDGVVRALSKYHPERNMPFQSYYQGDMLQLIEMAAKDGKESVLRALFECSGTLGTPTGTEYLRVALRVAKREKQNGATSLLLSFLEADSLG